MFVRFYAIKASLFKLWNFAIMHYYLIILNAFPGISEELKSKISGGACPRIPLLEVSSRLRIRVSAPPLKNMLRGLWTYRKFSKKKITFFFFKK